MKPSGGTGKKEAFEAATEKEEGVSTCGDAARLGEIRRDMGRRAERRGDRRGDRGETVGEIYTLLIS